MRATIQDFTLCLKNRSLFECANKKSQRKKITTWLGVGVYYNYTNLGMDAILAKEEFPVSKNRAII